MVAPGFCVEDNGHAEFIASTTSVAPKEISLGNVDLDIRDGIAVRGRGRSRFSLW